MNARNSLLASAGLAVLPLFAAGVGLSRFLSSRADSSPVAPIADFCQLAYSRTLDLAGHAGFGLFAVVMAVFASRAAYLLWRALSKRREICRMLNQGQGQTLTSLTMVPPVHTDVPIRIVTSDQPWAFTLGYLKPSVVLGSRLCDLLTEEELEAVVRHELVHACRRDPLRMLLAAFFRAGMPFVPVIGHLLHQFELKKETEADSEVVVAMGSAKPLASALAKVIESGGSPDSSAPAGLSATEARIEALLGMQTAGATPLQTTGVVMVSLISVAFVSLASYLLFSSPTVVTQHVCWPSGF